MLCVELKPRTGVNIGRQIRVTNNSDVPIRISIDAPRSIGILRDDAKKKKPSKPIKLFDLAQR